MELYPSRALLSTPQQIFFYDGNHLRLILVSLHFKDYLEQYEVVYGQHLGASHAHQGVNCMIGYILRALCCALFLLTAASTALAAPQTIEA